MNTSEVNLAKELLRIEREISNFSFQKSKAEGKDKDYWEQKVKILRITLNEIKKQIDSL